jgi:exodeoxyribonuclease VII small subunit
MTTARKKAVPQGDVPYAQALEELERILDDLEGDSIGVDELASHVKRASELIQLCRRRLTRSRAEIEQVVADLEAHEQEGESEAG